MEPQDDYQETRHFPRVRSESLISVRPLASRGAVETVTTTKVVGLGGVAFEYPRRISIGRKLELTVLVGVELVRITVKVVWCRKADDGRWGVGVQFEDITEEERDKILDLLMRRLTLEEELGK